MLSGTGIAIDASEQRFSEVLQGKSVADAAEALRDFEELYLVYDSKLARAAGILSSSVRFRAAVAVEASEKAKTMETVLGICGTLLEAGASRKAVLVALGGGITGDIAGFAASIYKRGIGHVNIPTTLLSQVDASIGGKCGVNFSGYKNMLGAIRQPLFTILCPDLLRTLPRRQLFSGAAEMLKTFIISDVDGALERSVSLLSAIPPEGRPSFDEEVLSALIVAAAGVKAEIVTRDPFEKGERRVLNLGHTFAHAIERRAALLGDDILHGEAVAMGIVLAAKLSDRLGESASSERTFRGIFERAGIPVSCPYTPGQLHDDMLKDKKAGDGTLAFVLPRAVGDVIIKELNINDLRLFTE